MAPASVGIDSFPNKKPKLSGDIAQITKGPEGSNGGNGNLSNLVGSANIGGFSFTATSNKNVAFLRASVYVTNDAFVRILEGATILASAGGSGTGTRIVSHIVQNTTIGLHTYSYVIVNNGPSFQYGQSGGFGNNGPISQGSSVDIIDTHDTKNTNIING